MEKGLSRYGWPRGLRRTEAAEYIGVGASKFDEMVADGRMPQPKQIDARRVWDRYQLDCRFEDLPGGANYNEWDEVLERSEADQAQKTARSKRPINDGGKGAKGYPDSDPPQPSAPLGKLEQKALDQLASYGTCVPVPWAEIKGCGFQTAYKLAARGFLNVDYEAHYLTLTEAGANARNSI